MTAILTIGAEDLIPEAAHVLRQRSKWLHVLAHELEPEFEKRGFCYPSRMSIEARLPQPSAEIKDGGFTSGETQSMPRSNWIRQLNIAMMIFNADVYDWSKKHHPAAKDYQAEVRIRANIPLPIFAAGTLCHELCHAVMPPWEGHGVKWSALARSMGLEGSDEGLHKNGGQEGYLSSANAGRGFTRLVRPILAKMDPYPKSDLKDFDIPTDVYFRLIGQSNRALVQAA